MLISEHLSLVFLVSVLNTLIWYGVGRWRSDSFHNARICDTPTHDDEPTETCRNSCHTHVDTRAPSIRPLLTKGFMKYKENSLVKVPYPEWSILIQPNQTRKCDIVVNPHVARRRLYLCLAVVTVSADSTYNLLRIETDPDNEPKLAAPDSAILNITGFFNNVANDNGRKKLAQKMVKLLPNLHSLEHYIMSRLHERNLKPGSDVVVMVVNAGEMDLLANFACSCRAHNISMRNVMVFSGSDDVLPLIESFGAMGVYHSESFADVSRNASYEYLDRIFIDMMWYKSFSVWLLLKLKYNVLFQDVDLVWYRDPVHYFRTASTLPAEEDIGAAGLQAHSISNGMSAFTDHLLALAKSGADKIALFPRAESGIYSSSSSGSGLLRPGGGVHASQEGLIHSVHADSWGHSLNHLPQADAYLSDDGQRSLRYTPFFANSGFYYLVANERTEYFAWTVLTAFDLLHITGSHQNVFTIRLIESLDIAGIKPKLLSLREFPSGVKFNHDKPYMRAIRDRHEHPFIFHM